MAMVIGSELIEATAVLDASARIYRQRGHDALLSDLATVVEAHTSMTPPPAYRDVRVVDVPDMPRVECVLDHGDDPAYTEPGFSALVDAGWQVWVLVPAVRMGIGHTALRGTGVVLQQWWCDARGTVYFGTPERP